MSNNIPTLDVSRFDTQKQTFVSELGNAYEQWGFAAIVNHGIDSELINRCLKTCEHFFALPSDIKQQYFLDNGGTRGYTPFGTEIAKDASFVDLKEFWHVGREIEGKAPYPQLIKNIWPVEISNFKTDMLALYQALDKLGNTLLCAFAQYLQEDSDYFKNKVNNGNSILRPLHYPPILEKNEGCVRAAAHEDINLITLLVGSQQAGLEVLNQKDQWIPISIIEGSIICNVGDMLSRLTNNQLPSTTHRVVNPKGEQAKHSRYSIPFFMHPNPDMPLDCLEQCITDENPKQYEPILANDFLMQRLREIGLIK